MQKKPKLRLRFQKGPNLGLRSHCWAILSIESSLTRFKKKKKKKPDLGL